MRALACVVFALVMVPCSALMLHRAVLAHRQLRSGPLRAHADVSSPPFRYRKLDHVVLRCARIDRMLRFYVDVLGAKPEWTDRFNGTLHHLRVGDSLIDLVTSDCDFAFANGTPESAKSSLDHFAIRCDDYDAAQAEAWFAKHGVRVVNSGERFGADGQGFSLYVQDPEGNTVELKAGPSRQQ